MTTTKTASRHQALVFALVAALIAFLVAAAPQAAWAEETDSADTETTYVASAVVNGTTTSYTTLADAISNADSGSTVTLLADTTVSSKITISSTVTLDLNGKTLTLDNSSSGSNSAARLLYIDTNGSLTVKDSTATSTSSGDGSITNTGYSYGIFDVYGALTIESGNFTDQGSGDGSTIKGRYTYDSSTGTISMSEITISGGTFTVSYDNSYNNATVSDSGEVAYTADHFGNYIINATYSIVDISGGTFNVGQNCWGAILLNGGCYGYDEESESLTDVSISGVTITTYDGTGIEAYASGLIVSNSTITVKNARTTDYTFISSAFAASGEASITVSGGTYSAPYAVYVYSSGGSVTINSGTFTGTTAVIKVDAVASKYQDDEGSVTSSVTVTNGTLTGDLSVASDDSASLTVTGGTYTDEDVKDYINETSSCTTSTTNDEDGSTTTTYTLTADAYVAKIVTTDDDGNETATYYATVQAAIDATSSGSTVTLLCDVSGSAQIGTSYNVSGTYILYVNSGKNLTLDLGGYTMTLNDDYIYAYGSTLTITNGTIADERCASSESTAYNLKTIYVYSSTLKLENVKITAYAPTSSWNYVILGYYGDETISLNEVTITDLSSEREGFLVGVFIEGYYYNNQLEAAQADSAYVSTLTIENSNINVTGYAVAGDGAWHGTSITISGSTLVSTTATAIYHPQYGTMTIKSCTITGAECGIEVRAGTVTISDSTVSSTQTTTLGTYPNGSGTSVQGAGIAISQHSTDIAISVTITNCTVSGAAAVYEVDLMNEDSDDISLSIVSGTYTATGTSIEVTASDNTVTTTTTTVPAVYSENCTGFISGGYFSTVVDEAYCASTYSPTTLVTVTSSDGTTSSYYTVARGTISFWGGSLRADNYATEGDDGTYTFSTDCADLRFGFCWDDLPEGATVTSFGWAWSTTESKVESATTCTVEGTVSRKADPTTYSYDQSTSGTVANLVITNIPTANFGTTIYVKMFLTYEVTDEDGNTTSITLVTDTYSRSVSYIAKCIVNDSSADTSSMVYLYANSVVAVLTSDEE